MWNSFNDVVIHFYLLMFVSSQEVQVFITASEQDEVTEEQIMAAIAKIRPPMEKLRRPSRAMDKEETVVNYHKKRATMYTRASFINIEVCFSV